MNVTLSDVFSLLSICLVQCRVGGASIPIVLFAHDMRVMHVPLCIVMAVRVSQRFEWFVGDRGHRLRLSG